MAFSTPLAIVDAFTPLIPVQCVINDYDISVLIALPVSRKTFRLRSGIGRKKVPGDCGDDPRSEEVGVVCCELSGDLLVGLQSPGGVVSAAVQLVYLRDRTTTR